MISKRMEKLKKARSLNDVMAIVKAIEFEFKNSQAVVKKLISSLSAEISFDSREQKQAHRVIDKEFVAPSTSEIQKHTVVIDKLHHNAQELEAAEALIKQAFTGNKKQPAALKAVEALVDEINASLNDALDALQAIADKHMPKVMSRLADNIVKYLIDTLNDKSYKDIYRQVYVTFDAEDKSKTHFSEYLGIEALKTTEGFKFDQYYIVLTGVVSKDGSITYYINSFPDFKVPGKYPLGKEVKDIKDARNRLSLLLSHNDFAVTDDKLPLPMEDSRVKHSGLTNIKGVQKASVANDELTVTLKPIIKTENQLYAVIKDIMARLNSILNSTSSKNIFTYKSSTINGVKVIKFILVPSIDKKEKSVNLQKLSEMAELLNLSDAQKKALKFALTQH